MPPSEPTQHGVLRGGWVQGAAGAQNSCKGKSDETRNRRFRMMIFKLLLWSPDGLSQAPRGPWSLQFPVWLLSLKPTEAGTYSRTR